MSFIRQDMQKLRDRTPALKGHLSTLEDDWAPLQWEVAFTHATVSQHAAKLEDLENRLRRNNV